MYLPNLFLDLFRSAERNACATPRILRRHARRDVFFGEPVDVKRHLGIELRFRRLSTPFPPPLHFSLLSPAAQAPYATAQGKRHARLPFDYSAVCRIRITAPASRFQLTSSLARCLRPFAESL